MKTKLYFSVLVSILFVLFFPCGHAFAWHNPSLNRTIDPIVSTAWLLENIENDNLVIIDIRDPGSYAAGHIPGSISEPFVTAFDPVCAGPSSNWIIGTADCLWLEVPPVNDLFNTLGNLGISPSSWVVVVTAPNPDEPPFYGLANGTRVAATLIYAGVPNVAILDGGYPKWVADGNTVATDTPVVEPISYRGNVNRGMFVSISHVRRNLWKADIIDARDVDVYFGVTIEPFADLAGHIPSASSLPAPWIWDLNDDGTYTFKDPETLGAMAAGVLQISWRYWGHWSPNLIVYCGVGGYASSWWFVLTQVLGYHSVKIYDGAAQEWVRYYDMVPFQWD